jgi:hypothetical protein
MSALQSPVFVIDGLDISDDPTRETATLDLEGIDRRDV